MSVKERLKYYAKTKEKSIRAFEINAGIGIGYINAIRVSIQPDKIKSIASYYPDLNIVWLLTGEGEMLKQEAHNVNSNNIRSNNGNNQIINGTAANVSLGGNERRIDEIENNHQIRTAEIEKNYNALLAAKDEIINELKNQIRQLTAQNEQLTTVLKLFHERK